MYMHMQWTCFFIFPVAIKLIAATIKPFKLDEVRSALVNAGIQDMTVSEVMGFVQQGKKPSRYEDTVNFLPKVQIEVTVQDKEVDQAIETIIKASRTGKIGDGKVSVIPVDKAIRIRTGEEI